MKRKLFRPNLADHGPGPYLADIARQARQNGCFRRTLWTGCHMQLTLMCIPAGDDIGLEVHHVDQYIRIEKGRGIALVGTDPRQLKKHRIGEGEAILVPAGVWHNILNTSDCPLKLTSLYAPPEHPPGTVHATQQIAEAAEGHYE